MLQIKGSVLKGTIELTKEMLGESDYNLLINMLNEEEKELLQNPISTSGWYPLDVYTHFLDILVREKFGGNSIGLVYPTEALIEKHLKGIYSVFIKGDKDSPESLIRKMAALNFVYLKGSEFESSIVATRKGKIKYTGFEKHHAVFESCLIGFFRKAAQVYGAKNVKVEFTTRIAEGKGYTEMFVTWDEK